VSFSFYVAQLGASLIEGAGEGERKRGGGRPRSAVGQDQSRAYCSLRLRTITKEQSTGKEKKKKKRGNQFTSSLTVLLFLLYLHSVFHIRGGKKRKGGEKRGRGAQAQDFSRMLCPQSFCSAAPETRGRGKDEVAKNFPFSFTPRAERERRKGKKGYGCGSKALATSPLLFWRCSRA